MSFAEGCFLPPAAVIRAMVVAAASESLGMTLVDAAGRRRFNEILWFFSYAHATSLRSVKYFEVITGKLVLSQ